MKKLSVALLMSTATLHGARAAEDLTWYFDHDEGSGFLAVVAEKDANSPEPHYPFLMSCSDSDDWNMVISDVDPKELGASIAGNQQPTVSLETTKDGKTEESEAFYPDISFSQTESVWEYSTIWDLATIEHLATVDEIRVKGTGVDRVLPTKAMKKSLEDFKTFCAGLNAAAGGGGGGGGDGGDSGAP
jgi:hypothetical protein